MQDSAAASATTSTIESAAEIRRLHYELRAARAEVGKLHRQMNQFQRTVQRELAATRRDALAAATAVASSRDVAQPAMGLTPVGHIESCFTHRNGTPRQPGLAPNARARLRVTWGSVPSHTLDGLDKFSHIWLLFHFDQNRGDEVVKSKVRPPRLDGAPTGVFACRSPHRPNPIGLSLVTLDRVDGDTLYLSGADLIDGTPVLDIKPYVQYADKPPASCEVHAPDWVLAGATPRLRVQMTPEARANIQEICAIGKASGGTAVAALRFFGDAPEAAEAAIVQVLQADPRSVYRKQKCAGQLYQVCVDGLDATCAFGDDGESVTVQSVRLVESAANTL
mmetsp:Transcript_27482/g.69956  ORF Transcript_27482/g.69956 Transcript_27482/m.69956 type:complete len:336 (-) Transcript_27482:997-2004(-)|eukprot:CAMPEP_0115857882 /NCGR_PEP_ID=MMETSP0287-20121206/15807_1 /TAXON_ID=412157 /ORGANISM="Chrysochromulina rotalis, Strain UIO044" /LENGTH=335 /DNA_ID=CAMNT_0003312121 /DNA_START=324 /DNA_END=1331 /DNA_ORIENTATION=+